MQYVESDVQLSSHFMSHTRPAKILYMQDKTILSWNYLKEEAVAWNDEIEKDNVDDIDI